MPKTTTKSYLRFVPHPVPAGYATKRWAVHSLSNELLGWVQWHAPWRRYVFGCANVAVFDAACLAEITRFLEREIVAHKEARISQLTTEAVVAAGKESVSE